MPNSFNDIQVLWNQRLMNGDSQKDNRFTIVVSDQSELFLSENEFMAQYSVMVQTMTDFLKKEGRL